jgi:branched-chain amino acid aminotransferase
MTTDFTELASVDGGIGPTAEATIGLKDDGLYRGDGAFEVIRVYAGRPFALDDHVARLERSAAALRLEFDRMALRTEIDALLVEAGPIEGQLRLIVTRGGRRIAATEPIPHHDETIRLASVTYQPTIILNGVKSLSYGGNMLATRLAKEVGAEEALLVRPDGIVLEPPTSSIFWVAEGALRTTSLAEGVLASITRDRLMRAVPGIEEGAWTLDDLKAADEAFLASTTRELQAVASIDGVAIAAAPGPRTRAAQEAFAAARDAELEAEAARV